MTKTFDALLESMLAEMMPASMMDDFGPGEMASAVGKKINDLPGKSQHWGPLQKVSAGDRHRIIRAIINNVFTEKGNTYTPMADDKDQLKELIKSAITKATKENPEFKAGGKWAVQFLADRLANEELLGKVKYATEGGKEIKKDVTQKELKAALNAALADTKGQSVWKKSAESELNSQAKKAAKQELVPQAEVPEQELEKAEVETVYSKAADLDSDDEELQKAFSKLPENTELSWDQVIKKIGTSKALALLEIGGLTEKAIEKEVGEEEDVPALDELDDEGADLSNFDRVSRMIDPAYSDTRGSGSRFWED
jgi:hypothetical protein